MNIGGERRTCNSHIRYRLAERTRAKTQQGNKDNYTKQSHCHKPISLSLHPRSAIGKNPARQRSGGREFELRGRPGVCVEPIRPWRAALEIPEFSFVNQPDGHGLFVCHVKIDTFGDAHVPALQFFRPGSAPCPRRNAPVVQWRHSVD